MKAILSAAVAVGLCGLAGAGDKEKAADPVGTWKLAYEVGDRKRSSTLAVEKDGDKLAGTMSWADQKDVKLKGLKAKGGELTFSADREVMGNTPAVEYKLTVDGDRLTGKGSVDAGGEKREFDIEGKREKKDK